MEAITRRLPECEEMVMTVVWDALEAPDLAETRRRVNEKFDKTWKPQTVSTFLTRLVHKGFLTFYRKGRYSYYEPVVNKEEYCAAEVIRIADMYFAGDMEKLAQFVRAEESRRHTYGTSREKI